jgi:hypothetical protein
MPRTDRFQAEALRRTDNYVRHRTISVPIGWSCISFAADKARSRAWLHQAVQLTPYGVECAELAVVPGLRLIAWWRRRAAAGSRAACRRPVSCAGLPSRRAPSRAHLVAVIRYRDRRQDE